MDAATQRALSEHTRRFYDEHAAGFSATRNHPWPGWQRAIRGWQLPSPLRVLDTGCGNGRLASWLAADCDVPVAYTGVDACEALLEIARERCIEIARERGTSDARERWTSDARLLRADLSGDPAAGLDGVDSSLPEGPFDLVCAFGLLHHVAGFERRRELIESLARRVAPGGRLALAFWRFAGRERFAKRRLAWALLPGIDETRLEPGDHLLAWGDEGAARYCHASDDAEIEALIARVELARRDDFEADGRDGDLNRYLLLERP